MARRAIRDWLIRSNMIHDPLDPGFVATLADRDKRVVIPTGTVDALLALLPVCRFGMAPVPGGIAKPPKWANEVKPETASRQSENDEGCGDDSQYYDLPAGNPGDHDMSIVGVFVRTINTQETNEGRQCNCHPNIFEERKISPRDRSRGAFFHYPLPTIHYPLPTIHYFSFVSLIRPANSSKRSAFLPSPSLRCMAARLP